jgi:hypothetical protein
MKYRIQLVESERGWGQEYWYEFFDSITEAEKRIREVNSKNNEKFAPDWYIAAFPEITLVEE